MKQTEIGVIPENWEVINLNKNFTLKARIGWQGLTVSEYLDSGDYILVTGTDFEKGYIDWDNVVFVEKERYVQDPNIQLKTGDILVTKDGTIGKVAFISNLPNPATLNSGVFVIRATKTGIISQYIYYVLMSFYFNDFLSRITAGSTITHLYQKDFVHFNLPLPPLTEQQSIAEALGDQDAWIESLEALIRKKRLIKQGAMQELLRPKKGWRQKCVGDVMSVYRGGSPRPIQNYISNDQYGINWIKIGDTNSSEKYILSTAEKITPEGERYSRRVFVGDFLLSNSMSFGRPYILKVDGCIHDGWLVLQNYQEEFDTEFLYYFLSSDFVIEQYKSKAAGSSVLNLNKELVSSVILSFPTKAEQIKIASILSEMDNELNTLEQKLLKARQIKQGMMQQLLTGKIRLVKSTNEKATKTLKRVTA